MKDRPVLAVSLVDAVENRIKRLISSGQLKPNDKLPSESVLQAELGVSRLALREALARLEALGLIRVMHGKGAVVSSGVRGTVLSDVLIPFFPQQSETRLRDLVDARGLIEGEISALASVRATDQELAEAEQLLLWNPGALSDPELFADVDFAFHHHIATIAANSFLLLMHEALGPHIRAFVLAYAGTADDRTRAHERNLELLRTLKGRDPAQASRMAREHLQPCLKGLLATPPGSLTPPPNQPSTATTTQAAAVHAPATVQPSLFGPIKK